MVEFKSVNSRRLRCHFGIQAAVGLAIAIRLLLPATAFGFNPKSPEVRAIIDKGLAFLTKNTRKEQDVGEVALAALCFAKENKKEHPTIGWALAAMAEPNHFDYTTNYVCAVEIMLLSELDSEQHKPKLDTAVAVTLKRQERHGGWGYSRGAPMEPPGAGDISQTQLVMMALWSAQHAGAQFPKEHMERAANFLLRVQDPSGGWGYQAVDPQSFNRVAQPEVRTSLAVGGLGATLIAADLLHFGVGGFPSAKPKEKPRPSALQVAPDPATGSPKVREPLTRLVEAGRIDSAIREGFVWVNAHQDIDAKAKEWEWPCYYLYGRERAESFRDLYVGKREVNPAWYDYGVKFLRDGQDDDGGWGRDKIKLEYQRVPQACLALMFLMRSTEKAIIKVKNYGDGLLTSGVGLPQDLANARPERGKLVDKSISAVLDVQALLDDPDNPEIEKLLEYDTQLKLSDDVSTRASQVDRLRKLVSHEKYEARMKAVQELGKTRDFDNVPVLLYAMTDPDFRVVIEADAALRFISRRFGGVGMPVPPTNEKDARDARESWRQWYRSFKPDAEFID